MVLDDEGAALKTWPGKALLNCAVNCRHVKCKDHAEQNEKKSGFKKNSDIESSGAGTLASVQPLRASMADTLPKTQKT